MKLTPLLVVALLMVLISSLSVQAVSSNVDFSGTLVVEPCVVVAGGDGDNIVVDFGVIPDKTFYSSYTNRTWLQPFHIQLKDCDLSLGKEVKITFSGTEDGEQPGLLAVSSSTGVTHVAVGLQTSEGIDIGINTQTDAYVLSAGNTQLNFKAYIQASNEGVRNQSINLGAFEAVLNFELEYP